MSPLFNFLKRRKKKPRGQPAPAPLPDGSGRGAEGRWGGDLGSLLQLFLAQAKGVASESGAATAASVPFREVIKWAASPHPLLAPAFRAVVFSLRRRRRLLASERVLQKRKKEASGCKVLTRFFHPRTRFPAAGAWLSRPHS